MIRDFKPTYLDIADIIEEHLGSHSAYKCSNGLLHDVSRGDIENAAIALVKATYDKT